MLGDEKGGSMDTKLTFRLTDEMYRDILVKAAKNDCSMGQLVRDAVTIYLGMDKKKKSPARNAEDFRNEDQL